MIRRSGDMKGEVREKMRGGAGSVTVRHYFSKDEFRSKTRLCAKLILPPGCGIGLHQHDAEDEVYIVLAGSGVLNDGISQSRISSGDAVLTGNGESHSILNDGGKPLEMVAVINCY